jgi:hypothetical protein
MDWGGKEWGGKAWGGGESAPPQPRTAPLAPPPQARGGGDPNFDGQSGGTYNGPAFRALADAYVAGKITIPDDNPYLFRVKQSSPFGKAGGTAMAGDLPAIVHFNMLAYGRAIGDALQYESLRRTVEMDYGAANARPSPGEQPRFPRLQARRVSVGAAW